MDFKKGSDLVPSESLWQVLKRQGVSRDVFSSLQSIYDQDKACVLTGEGPTEMFEWNVEVKQGCPASVLLLSLYLDELEAMLEDASEHIDCPCLAQLLIAILIFANDIALFSYSPRGLQHPLDILQEFFTFQGLKVNVQKTKIMV